MSFCFPGTEIFVLLDSVLCLKCLEAQCLEIAVDKLLFNAEFSKHVSNMSLCILDSDTEETKRPVMTVN